MAARLTASRLGHQVAGIRGLYAHASDRMRDDLKAALILPWAVLASNLPSLSVWPGPADEGRARVEWLAATLPGAVPPGGWS